MTFSRRGFIAVAAAGVGAVIQARKMPSRSATEVEQFVVPLAYYCDRGLGRQGALHQILNLLDQPLIVEIRLPVG